MSLDTKSLTISKTFEVSQKELETLAAWIEKNPPLHPAGEFDYTWMFHTSPVGEIIEVQNDRGQVVDITDYDKF